MRYLGARHISFLRILALLIIIQACDTSDSIDPRFNQFFIKYYGDTGDQYGEDVSKTPDGGYIIVGTSDPDRSMLEEGANGDEDIVLIKTDSLGNEEWIQFIDAGGNIDFGKGVLPTANGYIVVGTSLMADFDGVYFETDMQGNPGLIHFAEEGGNEFFENVTELNDGFIMAGYTDNVKSEQNGDDQDFLTIKIFNDLTVPDPRDPSWEQNKINGREGDDYGIQAFYNPDLSGQIAVFGYTDDPDEDFNVFDQLTYVSLEYDGQVLGKDTYYGDTEDQVCFDISERPGGFLMTGTKSVGSNLNEMYFVRTDGIDNTQVNMSVFTEVNLDLEGRSIVSAFDNNVIHLGEITYQNGDRDIFLGKTDINGGSIWSETFGSSGNDLGAKVIQDNDGAIVFTGTMNLSGQNKIFLIKTNADGQLKL